MLCFFTPAEQPCADEEMKDVVKTGLKSSSQEGRVVQQLSDNTYVDSIKVTGTTPPTDRKPVQLVPFTENVRIFILSVKWDFSF